MIFQEENRPHAYCSIIRGEEGCDGQCNSGGSHCDGDCNG
jgi:hypothetical protein